MLFCATLRTFLCEFSKKSPHSTCNLEKKVVPLHRNARMAESVDATVSNTVGETHPGSTPGPGTREMQRNLFLSFLYVYMSPAK